MRKILSKGLGGLLICSILISCSSCKDSFKWNPKPYTGVSEKQHIIRADGSKLRCDEPRFNKIVCLNEVDLTSLVIEISRHNKKAGKKAKAILNKIKNSKK